MNLQTIANPAVSINSNRLIRFTYNLVRKTAITILDKHPNSTQYIYKPTPKIQNCFFVAQSFLSSYCPPVMENGIKTTCKITKQKDSIRNTQTIVRPLGYTYTAIKSPQRCLIISRRC